MNARARTAGMWLLIGALLVVGGLLLRTPNTPPAAAGTPTSSASTPETSDHRTRPPTLTATTTATAPVAAPPGDPTTRTATPSQTSSTPPSAAGEPMDVAGADPADIYSGQNGAVMAVSPTSPEGQAAIARAHAFTAAYSRPACRVDQQAWWAKVTPHLTEQAAHDYEGANPARIPWTTVTGPGQLVPLGDGTVRVAAVSVPTDAGAVLVHLSPTGPTNWLVSRVEMPQGKP